MEIENESLMSVQGQFALGMQRKSLDFSADMVSQLIQGSTEAADMARAEQGIGTKLNVTA